VQAGAGGWANGPARRRTAMSWSIRSLWKQKR
jgi:hypothetical protein